MADEVNSDDVNWELTTYRGSRREQFRRAAEIPFDQVLDSIEEMGELVQDLAERSRRRPPAGDSPDARASGEDGPGGG